MKRRSFVVASIAYLTSVVSSRARKRKDVSSGWMLFDGYWVQRWAGDTITILDHGLDSEALRTTIADFQRHMPTIKLSLHDRDVVSCDDVTPPVTGELVVCESEGFGWGHTQGENGIILTAMATIGNRHRPPGITCHELMHAMTGIGDDYIVRSQGTRDSCVHGWNERLGSWDISLLESLYASDKTPPKKHHHKKHR